MVDLLPSPVDAATKHGGDWGISVVVLCRMLVYVFVNVAALRGMLAYVFVSVTVLSGMIV